MDESLSSLGIFGLALLGVAMAAYGAWQAWAAAHVRSRVTAHWGTVTSSGDATLAITIANLGALPFTVVGVGLKMGGAIYLPLFVIDAAGSELPKRLQARTSITVLAPARTHEHPSFGGVSAVYVSTDCGMRITRCNGLLRQLTKEAWIANR